MMSIFAYEDGLWVWDDTVKI